MNRAKRVKELATKLRERVRPHTGGATAGKRGPLEYRRDQLCSEAADLIDAMQSALDDAEAKLAARDAEVERLRKDAERFEKLQKDFSSSSLDIDGNHCWVYRRNFSLSGPTLRAAIDKALSEEVKGGE